MRMNLKIAALVALAYIGIIGAYAQKTKPKPKTVTQSATKPSSKPDVIIFLVDDMGYSDLGCYGSEINTPNLDRLAANGRRFTQFYNNARCCPSRASLLTGMYSHKVGIGHMNGKLGENPAYAGHLSHSTPTFAEVLKTAGYLTFMSGKWHVGDDSTHWACRRGFDEHFGLINGAAQYFSYNPYRINGKGKPNKQVFTDKCCSLPNNTQTPYFTYDIADHAAKLISKADKKKPYVQYVAFTAPHWPLQAPDSLIDKYLKIYSDDYLSLRKQRVAKQKAIGVIRPDAEENIEEYVGINKWVVKDTFNVGGMARKLATYAASIEAMDQAVGKVLKAVKARGNMSNTVIIFASDNGASQEEPQRWDGMIKPAPGKNIIGKPESMAGYGPAGAWLSNAPFKGIKAQHYEGGIISPLIIHYPALIKSQSFNNSVSWIGDLTSTIYHLCLGTSEPTYQGKKIKTDGISLLPAITENKLVVRPRPLVWEHEGFRCVRLGDMKLVAKYKKDWELFDLAKDPTEIRNLAKDMPEKVAELDAIWVKWAAETGAVKEFETLKLDWSKLK